MFACKSRPHWSRLLRLLRGAVVTLLHYVQVSQISISLCLISYVGENLVRGFIRLYGM